MKYRHELKYLIDEGDAELVRERLDAVMRKDSHVIDGQYHIRSLYFDDYWDSAYLDKIGGFNERRKYRIRIYNLTSDVIKLECKIKKDAYIAKLSAPLSYEEFEKIWRGEYSFLLCRKEPLCRQFYYECVSRVMRPRVYVDYEREPYIMDAGDVRITFDRNVRGAYPGDVITSRDMVFNYVLEPGKLVMEVKFTELLPQIIRDILPVRAAEHAAVSKYAICCESINYMTAKEAQ